MFDRLMYWIFDEMLDDLWAGIARRDLVRTAANVGFNLAFITEFKSIDDQDNCTAAGGCADG